MTEEIKIIDKPMPWCFGELLTLPECRECEHFFQCLIVGLNVMAQKSRYQTNFPSENKG